MGSFMNFEDVHASSSLYMLAFDPEACISYIEFKLPGLTLLLGAGSFQRLGHIVRNATPDDLNILSMVFGTSYSKT